MRGCAALLLMAVFAHGAAAAEAQRGAAPAATRIEPALVECPSRLGYGVATLVSYCDVMIERDPEAGIIVTLPPHTGPVRLMFDLHNRHLYSEDQIRTDRAYRRYTASIGVLTMDNTLVSRALIQSEFRSAADLVDRIANEPEIGGLKAVAPTGTESIVITIPEGEARVSILGERLTVVRTDGVDNFTTAERPMAVISNVAIEYRPGPVRRPPARR
jgi:hypothetical protein